MAKHRYYHGVWVLALLLVGIESLAVAPRLRQSITLAQSTPPSAQLQELAERLLITTFPSPAPAVASLPYSSPVQLLPGTLPADLPLSVPEPPGSVLIGSAERPSAMPFYSPLTGAAVTPTPAAPAGRHIDVVLDASGEATDLIGFYTSAMAALGWTPPTQPTFPGPSGFLPSTSSQSSSAVFCQSQNGPSLAVSARPMANGSLDVRLALETAMSGFSSVCGGPRGPLVTSTLPVGQGLLPRLPAPAGVTVQQQSGGSVGGPGRSSFDALATTDISVGGLEALYEQELVTAGWMRTDGDSTAGLAWSTWSIPDQNDWQGFLYARLGPGDGQRLLHVEVASASQQTYPGVNYGGSAYAYPYPVPGSVGSCAGIALSPGEVCENGIVHPPVTATPIPAPPGSGR